MGANKLIRYTLVLAVATSSAGCLRSPIKEKENYKPAVPMESKKSLTNANGAIYQSDTAIPLYEDRKANRVGDIIIVVLNEATNASKNAKTNTSKENKVNSQTNTLLGMTTTSARGLGRLNNDYSVANEFSGSGDSAQSNNMTGTIAVTVQQVLPNGNLIIRGEKRWWLNQGEEFIQLSGIVRPSDVSTDNMVLSTRVADASIKYKGKGQVADSNTMGWMSRFFNSKWWPL